MDVPVYAGAYGSEYDGVAKGFEGRNVPQPAGAGWSAEGVDGTRIQAETGGSGVGALAIAKADAAGSGEGGLRETMAADVFQKVLLHLLRQEAGLVGDSLRQFRHLRG